MGLLGKIKKRVKKTAKKVKKSTRKLRKKAKRLERAGKIAATVGITKAIDSSTGGAFSDVGGAKIVGDLLEGKQPDWKNAVRDIGTNYANAAINDFAGDYAGDVRRVADDLNVGKKRKRGKKNKKNQKAARMLNAQGAPVNQFSAQEQPTQKKGFIAALLEALGVG